MGMREPNRQSVGIVLTLAGRQDTAIAAQQPQTDSASVSVRIGRTLIYLHDRSSVDSYVRAWQGMSGAATGLPKNLKTPPIRSVRGMAEPGVVVNATGDAEADGRLVGGRGGHPYLRLVIGRLLFIVRDIPAFASTMLAFREVDMLAKETFFDAKVPPLPLRQKAVEDAAAAFRAPPARRASALAKSDPSSSAVVPARPRLSQEWMR